MLESQLATPDSQGAMAARTSPWSRIVIPRTALTAIAFIVLFGLGGLIRPSLFSVEGLVSTAAFASILALASFGQTVAVIQAGIDLSVPNTIAFAALSYLTWVQTLGPVLAMFASLFCGVVIGTINGIVISKLGLTPIVTTIAMNGLLFGVLLLNFSLSELTKVPPFLESFTSDKIDVLGVGVAAVIPLALVIMIVLQLVLSYTGWGRSLFMLGSAPAAARLAGQSVDRVRITGYALSSLLAAFSGITIVGYFHQAEATMGASYLLGSVAAVVVGGASIFGGSGSVIGTFFGALVLGQVGTLVAVLNLGTTVQNLIYGVIILIVVAAYGRAKRHS